MTTPVERTLTAPGDVRGLAPVPRAPLTTGARLGRYVLGERLGSGGMSTVFRAEDPALRRSVAIKLLRADLAVHAIARERFAREGQAMAALTHANVATVFDVGEHDGHCFLAIELCEGGTLATWLAPGRGWREVVAMMRAAARGLVAAHARGIVHRDFKPDNVLLTADGTPRVADFGLASLDDVAALPAGPSTATSPELTDAGTVLGTPAYMAPEQRDGRPAGEPADQYSLCLMWLEALGRDRAAAAGDPGRARAPAWLVAILMRGLDGDPARRWPSVAGLVRAIDRRRRRRAAAVIAAAAIATAAIAIGWHLRAPRTDRLGEPTAIARAGAIRMTVTDDGGLAVRASADRSALSLDDLRSGASRPLVLPPGARISRRMDALPGASRGGATVLVRLDDNAVWRTGRELAAPVLLARDAGGAACVDPTGRRIAVGNARAPLTIRDPDDGHVLAETATADFCAWRGDELVLAVREPEHVWIRVRAADGQVRDLAELSGDLAGVAIDRRGRIVVAHNPRAGGAALGTLTAIAPDGTRTELYRARRAGEQYQYLSDTDGALIVTSVIATRRLALVDAASRSSTPRLLTTPVEPSGIPLWLDDDRLAFATSAPGVMMTERIGGAITLAPLDGVLVGRAGDELFSLARVEAGAGVQRPRCTLHAARAGHTRTVAQWTCGDRTAVTCDGGQCAIGRIVDDEVWFSRLDPGDGQLSAVVTTRPLARQPAVAIGPDGRWLVVSGGELAVIDPATGASTAIATGAWRPQSASWGHDGRYLVAVTRDEVLRIGLDGAVTVLASSPTIDLGAPRVSPGGTWIAAPAYPREPEYLRFQ